MIQINSVNVSLQTRGMLHSSIEQFGIFSNDVLKIEINVKRIPKVAQLYVEINGVTEKVSLSLKKDPVYEYDSDSECEDNYLKPIVYPKPKEFVYVAMYKVPTVSEISTMILSIKG
ncbi:hypothetical protein ROZALSC1DRAFT_27812, partial [Rozella allomycis CSF55]